MASNGFTGNVAATGLPVNVAATGLTGRVEMWLPLDLLETWKCGCHWIDWKRGNVASNGLT